MKAISLWQPWATAIALGSKRVETRHWATKYRGPLAIHAAKRLVKIDLDFLGASWEWRGALGWLPKPGEQLWDWLPFGTIVATCDLVACRRSESFTMSEIGVHRSIDLGLGERVTWTERDMGNFQPDRFGWVLDNIRALPKPVPFRGLQGLFNVPDELVA